jgi:hypothetical protein
MSNQGEEDLSIAMVFLVLGMASVVQFAVPRGKHGHK